MKANKKKTKTASNAEIKAAKIKSGVKKAQGAVSFKKVSGNSKITISKTGTVTVKKGIKISKKGKTYQIKVKATAAGNNKYKKATKTMTIKIKVKAK